MSIGIWLNGGLGNQLFMICCTLSYALDKNISCIIYSGEHNVDGGRPTYWTNLLENLYKYVKPYTNNQLVYKEPKFEYVPLPDYLSHNNYTLSGYFQSYKYFEHNYTKICNLLKIQEKKEFTKHKYSQYFRKKTIALHFRINDYRNIQDCHPIQTVYYYINALKHLLENLHDINEYDILYAFQDGDEDIVDGYIKLLKQHFALDFIHISHDIADWEQMLLMASCDHLIIANSTFSYFAAYFCTNPNKLVYCPKDWFGPVLAEHNTKDLCPNSWIHI